MELLINKYLGNFTFNEYHKILINAPAKDCFLIARNLDMGKSLPTKTLMKLRGLPAKDLRLQQFIRDMCFRYVEENLFQEFIIDASQTNIKIFWNFYFKEISNNKTLTSTETRILCLTKRSRFLFSIYWFFIRPFSGLIRIEMLRLIRKNAQKLQLNS